MQDILSLCPDALPADDWDAILRDPAPRPALTSLLDKLDTAYHQKPEGFLTLNDKSLQNKKVTSRGTTDFWQLYYALSPKIREAAQKAFQEFWGSPAHPGLQLERLRSDGCAWSVRMTRNYRAVGRRYDDD